MQRWLRETSKVAPWQGTYKLSEFRPQSEQSWEDWTKTAVETHATHGGSLSTQETLYDEASDG